MIAVVWEGDCEVKQDWCQVEAKDGSCDGQVVTSGGAPVVAEFTIHSISYSVIQHIRTKDGVCAWHYANMN